MLVLTRKLGENIRIGDTVKITVLEDHSATARGPGRARTRDRPDGAMGSSAQRARAHHGRLLRLPRGPRARTDRSARRDRRAVVARHPRTLRPALAAGFRSFGTALAI